MMSRPNTQIAISPIFVRAMEIRRDHRSVEADDLYVRLQEVINDAENAETVECTPREAALLSRIIMAFARIATTLRNNADKEAYASAVEALDALYTEQGTLTEDKMIRNMAEKLAPETDTTGE
jgi:hypothetical protein